MKKEIKHISGSAGGFLVGNAHTEGGIKAINKATGQPLEMEGGEVVITKPAVEDSQLYEFEGEMLTNRQILSKINESGGGVSFADGGEVPNELYFTGSSYKYGGNTFTDYEIAHKISSCGCKHKENGLSKNKTIKDIAAMHNVSVDEIETQLIKGIEVEAEHSDNFETQMQIAMDHLVENPKYYDILAEAKLEKGGELDSEFLRIEKLILQELKNRGLEKEYRITSKSKTDYGESWYIKFENGLEIRISDHSVQSMFRVFDDKYIDFINIYSTYEPEMAMFTIDRYVEKSKELSKNQSKINQAENRLQERINYIKEKSISFFEKLKSENKGVFFHGFTRISPSEFIKKYPNTELIFHIETKGGYEYFYVGENNFYSMKGLHPKYFNFLVKSKVIDAEEVEERIFYEKGGTLKSHENEDNIDNVTQVVDEVLDGPNIVASEGAYFEKGGEIKKENEELLRNNSAQVETKTISETNYSISNYRNPYEVNRAIEQLIDSKESGFTPNEIDFISNYSGYGGLEKQGSFSDEELKGLLYEYFTPDAIVKKMWALAYKYDFGTIENPHVMEPSVGTGNFFKYAPTNAELFGNEINRFSKKVCEILYPKAMITLQPFEKNFISKNNSIKNKLSDVHKYHLVIGNPPYGRADSKFLAMGEKDYTKANNFTEYFITRGLDLLHPGGLLIFVVGAEQYNGGTLFLDSGISIVKKNIFDKAQLLDAYRLPTKIFERTGVASEILVFKKK